MKRMNWGKKITILMAAVCVALAALSGTAKRPDMTLMLQVEGIPIYRDTYCYLLSEALLEAPKDKNGKPKDMQALRGDIVERCVSMVAIKSELYNREKTIDPQLKFEVAVNAAYAWRTFHAYYNSIGVNKQTVNSMFTANAAREQLFLSLYDVGGSQEVPEETLEAYFYANYAAYDRVRVFLAQENEDGTERSLDKAETAALRATLKKLVGEVNGGADFLDTSTSEAYAETLHYAAPMNVVVQKGSGIVTDEEFEKLRALETDKVALLEFDDYFMVARGIDMKESTDEYYQAYRNSCLWALQGDAYEEALQGLYKTFRADENVGAVEQLLAKWKWQPEIPETTEKQTTTTAETEEETEEEGATEEESTTEEETTSTAESTTS